MSANPISMRFFSILQGRLGKLLHTHEQHHFMPASNAITSAG